MTKMEAAIAKALFDLIKHKAQNLNFVDKLILGNALQKDSEFSELPEAQKKLFLDVAMGVVRTLQGLHGKVGNG